MAPLARRRASSTAQREACAPGRPCLAHVLPSRLLWVTSRRPVAARFSPAVVEHFHGGKGRRFQIGKDFPRLPAAGHFRRRREPRDCLEEAVRRQRRSRRPAALRVQPAPRRTDVVVLSRKAPPRVLGHLMGRTVRPRPLRRPQVLSDMRSTETRRRRRGTEPLSSPTASIGPASTSAATTGTSDHLDTAVGFRDEPDRPRRSLPTGPSAGRHDEICEIPRPPARDAFLRVRSDRGPGKILAVNPRSDGI